MSIELELDGKTHEARVAEVEKHHAEMLALPPHQNVAHIKSTSERFMLAAEYHRSEGSPVSWLHNASMAEGIAQALHSATGGEGLREGAMLRKATLLRIEAELALLAEIRTLQRPN